MRAERTAGRGLAASVAAAMVALVGGAAIAGGSPRTQLAILGLGAAALAVAALLSRARVVPRRTHADGWTVVLLVCTLPLIRWSGPFNSAIPDVAMLIVVVAGLWAVLARSATDGEQRLPPTSLLVWLGLYVAAGLAATPRSVDPVRSVVTLSQDLFLIAFWLGAYGVLYRSGRRPDLTSIARLWLLVAAGVGALVFLGPFAPGELRTLLTYGGYGGRGIGPFSDPNMAAHYLGLSLFLLPLALRGRGRRSLAIPFVATAAILLGFLGSGSNSAKVSLVVAGLVALAMVVVGSRGPLALRGAAATVLLLTAVSGAVVLSGEEALSGERRSARSRDLFRLSLFGNTLEERSETWRDAYEAFLDQPFGIGPGLLGKVRDVRRAFELEAHSDPLSALGERGIFGFVALLGFAVSWGRALARRWRRTADEVTRSSGLVIAAAGASAFAMTFSLAVDTLHFRHLWFLLAVFLPPAGVAYVGRSGDGGSAPGQDVRA